LFLILLPSRAQTDTISINLLEAYRDSITISADSIINAETEQQRISASYLLISLLRKTIKTPGSFAFDLSGIPGIIQVRQEDNHFRILTWQVGLDDLTFRYYGVIQFPDDTGRFVPLVDYSHMYARPEYIVATPNKWIGMAYYNIKTVRSGKNIWYTLFGYQGNNAFSTKKYVDIMWWDKDTLKFGAPLFNIAGMPTSPNRFVLEYSKMASATLNFSEEDNMIIYDHLTQMGGEDIPANYVPDGTYEGFVWEKGRWRQVDQVEYQKLEDGEAPMPNVKPKSGKILYQSK
jgi:hypothetical protein